MIDFRKVELSDMPQLKEIASTAFKHHRYWLDKKLNQDSVKEYYTRDLENLVNAAIEPSQKNEFIVAAEGEKIVGYIALRIDDLLTSTFGFKWGVIASFALREEYREKGLGSKMLKKALEWFECKAVSRVDVWTDAENISAIQCYEKAGFRTIYSGLTLTLNLNRGHPSKRGQEV